MQETVLSHLKLYLNSCVYHRNIFGSSSKVFGNLRKSSEIFGNSRKMFSNVRLAFWTILENLRKSSESGRKALENHQKRRHQYVYIIKRTSHVSSKIWILCSCHSRHRTFIRTLVIPTAQCTQYFVFLVCTFSFIFFSFISFVEQRKENTICTNSISSLTTFRCN